MIKKTLQALAFAFIFAAICSERLHAEIRPSFDLEDNTWHATDIVIASEGEAIDGELIILKVLAGNLKQGEKISVPELGKFSTKESRTLSLFSNLGNQDNPRVLTGKKLVLFLKRDGEDADLSWKPAAKFGGINVSVAWIDKGKVYAYTQIINPGSAVLVDQRHTEKELLQKIMTISKARNALRACREIDDPKARAKAAMAFVGSPIYRLNNAAFSLLAECGDDALPHLRKLLSDHTKLHLHQDAIKTLSITGAKAVVPELCQMVKTELAFWKKTAPGLKQGWWNNMQDKRINSLRGRYGLVLEIFYALERLKSPDCRTVVTEFRDYWRSLPQLEDKSGLNQMSRACDSVLNALPLKNGDQ